MALCREVTENVRACVYICCLSLLDIDTEAYNNEQLDYFPCIVNLELHLRCSKELVGTQQCRLTTPANRQMSTKIHSSRGSDGQSMNQKLLSELTIA
jgi:hypothetical protein